MRFRLRVRGLYWPAVVLAGASLVLVVANLFLLSNNQSVQAEVNQRQQFINQSIQLSRVNEALVRMLANAAINSKDDKLRELLAQQGINVTTTPSAASGTTTPTPSVGGSGGAAAAAPSTATPSSEKKTP